MIKGQQLNTSNANSTVESGSVASLRRNELDQVQRVYLAPNWRPLATLKIPDIALDYKQ